MLRSIALTTLLLAMGAIGDKVRASIISASSNFTLNWLMHEVPATSHWYFTVTPAPGCSAEFSHISIHTSGVDGWQTLHHPAGPLTVATDISLSALRADIWEAIKGEKLTWDSLEYNVTVKCDQDVNSGDWLVKTTLPRGTDSVFTVTAPSSARHCEAEVEDQVSLRLPTGASSGPIKVVQLTKGGSGCRLSARETRVALTNGGSATYHEGAITVTAGPRGGTNTGSMTVGITVE